VRASTIAEATLASSLAMHAVEGSAVSKSATAVTELAATTRRAAHSTHTSVTVHTGGAVHYYVMLV
jgi:hypothetical protein